MYNRRDKERELMEHHSGYLDKLSSSYQFIAKTAFYSKGKFGRQIQLFENELNKGSDIYVELVDIVRDAKGMETDMTPMYWERPLFKCRYNPYLESVVQRQGLFAYKVVMDDTNNTADVVDRNQLVGQIYIQPTKTAEFIILNFNILPTGATFPA